MTTIPVDLGDRSYDIRIESGRLDALGAVAAPHAPSGSVLLAVDVAVEKTHGARVAAALRDAGLRIVPHGLVADEARKSLAVVRDLYDTMLMGRLERGSAVVAVGGGIVGDIAGFAAATFLRGIACVQVPTTLLAMVDASIGGKTGVNLELDDGRLGKNLVGAFWQPAAVVVDPDVLGTLDARQFRCGLAESIKHAMLADRDLLSYIDEHLEAILALDGAILEPLIARSAGIKVAVVTADEREAGRRARLNLGHTFAHAIESRHDLGWHHGEAVAIGLCAASFVAAETGRLPRRDLDLVEAIIRRTGLPHRLTSPVSSDDLVAAMGFDKKVVGGRMRLVVPDGLGAATIIDDVEPDLVVAAWRHVGADA
ncbi:MAG: 3-dehydroquinate synthase [Phycisphaerales bacterium]|nr:3-dehydroquinate synthase [Phycisphaerales bacterium]